MKNRTLMKIVIIALTLCISLFLVPQVTLAGTPSVNITPLNPPAGTELTCSSPDIISNSVNYIFKWYVNDKLEQSSLGYNGGNPFTTAPSSTFPASKVTSGVKITCRIELNDGNFIADGVVQVRTDSTTPETNDDTIPIQITPTSPIPGTELMCSAKNPITSAFYIFKWYVGDSSSPVKTQSACYGGCGVASSNLTTDAYAPDTHIRCEIYEVSNQNNALGEANIYLAGTTVSLDAVGNHNISEGNLLTFTVTSNDPDFDTPTYLTSGIPAGALMNPSTGVFTWTPDYNNVTHPNTSQLYTFDIIVSDGAFQDTETISINVTDVNQLPVITNPIPAYNLPSDTNINRTVYQDLVFDATVTDADTDAMTLEWLIDGIVNYTGAAPYTLNKTNDPADVGTKNITLKVTDALGGISTASWFVYDINGTPELQALDIDEDTFPFVLTIDTAALTTVDLTSTPLVENSTYSFIFTAYDIDNVSLSNFNSTIATAFDSNYFNVTTDLPNAIVNITPYFNATNYSAGQLSNSFTFNVTDENGLTDELTLNVKINDTNRAPYFNDTLQNLTILENSFNDTLNLSLNATDIDNDVLYYTFNWISTDNNATIDINNATGLVNVTPDMDYYGNLTLEFLVWDGTAARLDRLSGTSNVVTIEVNNSPNRINLLQNVSNITLFEDNTTDSAYWLNLTDYLFTIDYSFPITYKFNSTNLNLSVNFTTIGNDTFAIFNATPNWYGNATLNISANNSLYNNITNNFNIKVLNVNDAPYFITAGWTNLTIDEDTPYIMNLSNYFNDSDNDNLTLTYSAQTNTSNLTPSVLGEVLTLTPALNWDGTAHLNITAYDGEFNVSSFTELGYEIFANITYINDAPVVDLKKDNVSVVGNMTGSEGSIFSIGADILELDFTDTIAQIVWTIINSIGSIIDQVTFAFTNVLNITYNESNFSFTNFSNNYTSAGDYNLTLNLTYTNGSYYNFTYNLTIAETYYDPVWNNSGLPSDIYVNEDSFNDSLNISDYVSSIDSAINLTSFNVINMTGNLTELNITFNDTDGIMNISPLADVFGDMIVKFNMSEFDGNWSLSDNVTVHVTNINDAPIVLANLTNQSIMENSSIVGTDLTTIFDDIDSSLTYTVNTVNDITNLTISTTGDVFNLSSQNVTELKGLYNFEFNITADDGEYNVTTDNFHVNVTYVDDVPIIGDVTALGNISVKNASTYNDPSLINLSDYFSDVDSALTFGVIIDDANANVSIGINSSELLNITATAGFIDFNTSNITVWADDGNITAGHNVSFPMTINADVDPFITDGVNFLNVTSTSVQFNFTAQEFVNYTLNITGGQTWSNATIDNYHSKLLTGLTAGTTYNYTLNITDVDDNYNITNGNFLTRPNDLGSINIYVNESVVGNNISNATIKIDGGLVGYTQANGTLNIPAYLEGNGYVLTVEKDGFVINTSIINVIYNQTTIADATLVPATNGEIMGGVYLGVLPFSAQPNEPIKLTDGGDTIALQYVFTDATGQYTFTGVPNGFYDVYFNSTDTKINSAQLFVNNNTVVADDYFV